MSEPSNAPLSKDELETRFRIHHRFASLKDKQVQDRLIGNHLGTDLQHTHVEIERNGSLVMATQEEFEHLQSLARRARNQRVVEEAHQKLPKGEQEKHELQQREPKVFSPNNSLVTAYLPQKVILTRAVVTALFEMEKKYSADSFTCRHIAEHLGWSYNPTHAVLTSMCRSCLATKNYGSGFLYETGTSHNYYRLTENARKTFYSLR